MKNFRKVCPVLFAIVMVAVIALVGAVTVFAPETENVAKVGDADELDMAGMNYEGTILAPEGHTLTITNAPEDLKTEDNVTIIKPNPKTALKTALG